MGTSYSYSVPSYGFTNKITTNNTDFPQESETFKFVKWPWQPGNCVAGAFNNGAGMLQPSITYGSNCFFPANQAPIPMRQSNDIRADVRISRPYDTARFNIYYVIKTTQINSVAYANFLFGIGGYPYLQSYSSSTNYDVGGQLRINPTFE